MSDPASTQWAIPPRLKIEKGPNPVLLCFKVWWPSLALSFVAWLIVVRVWASEDTWLDVFSFALTIASLIGLIYSFLVVILGLPMIIIACLKRKGVIWSRWFLFAASILLSILGAELLMRLIAQQSAFQVGITFPLIALGYGLITGVLLSVLKPK